MDQSEAVANFMAIAQCSEEQARFYLDSSKNDLDQALGAFYQSQDEDNNDAQGMVEDVSDESEGETLQRQGNISARGPGSNFPLPDDEDMVGSNASNTTASAPMSEYEKQARRAPMSALGGSSSGSQKKKKKSKTNKRVNTIFDNNESSSDDEDDADKPNNYYAGGGKSSGQYVQGPPGEDQGRGQPRAMDLGGSSHNHGGSDEDESDIVKSIFKRAQAEGHAPKHPPGEEPKKARAAFGGLGFALGDETTPDAPPQTVGTSLRETAALERESANETQNIVFWRNGFTVGDGDLRSYEDPANKEFLAALNSGYAPAELTHGRNMANVSVVVSDKKGEEYKPSKKPMKAFGGVGRTLGSPTPEVHGAGTVGVSATPVSSSGSTENPITLDEAQPTTSVQIRLCDGSRVVAKLNHTHTVGDLRAYIGAQPGAYTGAYSLMTPYPRKVLDDDSVSIADAKLLNAVVVQQKA